MGNQKNNQHVWPVAATSEKEGETKKAINLCSLAVMTASKNPKEQSTCVACCGAASRKKNNQPVAKWQKRTINLCGLLWLQATKNSSGLLGKQKKLTCPACCGPKHRKTKEKSTCAPFVAPSKK